MSLVASWRTALRIARREAGRSKGRSALVVAMIALPVLGLSFAAVSYDMFSLTGAETADQTMGTADARVRWDYQQAINQDLTGVGWPTEDIVRGSTSVSGASDGKEEVPKPPTDADLLAKLPAGSKVLPVRSGAVELKTLNGLGQPNAVAVDARDPLTTGFVRVTAGRAPQTPYEAAVTEQAAARLGQGIGGKITSGDGKRSYAVVGLVEFPSLLEEVVLFAPTEEEYAKSFSRSWLVDTPTPIDWAAIRGLNQSGIAVASREVFINPPPAAVVPNQDTNQVLPEDLAVGVIVAGLALLEIVLMAGPAFAVSARRRQRQLALVAANGGTPAHIRRIVLADGVVLGAVGAMTGIVLGIVVAFLARPYVEDLLTHRRAGAYRVYPLALLAIVALAVFTGVLAALVPAFITARQNVIASLAGRRGATRSKKRWIVLGLVMVAAGATVVISGSLAGSAWIMLTGLVVGELGLVLCTPALVGLIARFGRLLPLAPRIALRDAARNRAAAAPAISAVMAAVAGSVAIGLYLDSNVAQQRAGFIASMPEGYVRVYIPDVSDDPTAPPPPNRTTVDTMLRSTLPVVDIRTVASIGCPEPPAGTDPPTGPGGTATKPVRNNKMCDLRAQLPPDLACPYMDIVSGGERPLTKEEQHSASVDPRCAVADLWNFYNPVVDDGSAVGVLTGASAKDAAAAAAVLRAGGVVVRDARYLRDGQVTFAVINVDPSTVSNVVTSAPRMSFPGYVLTTGVAGVGPIVSPGALAKTGLAISTGSQRLVASTSRIPTQPERDRFDQQLNNLRIGGNITDGPIIRIPVELWLITAAAALITLGAAAIGTGLAAADGRADLSTLASVGASPRLRRGLSLSQSAVIAGLGSILGAVAGLGTAIAVLVALNQRYAGIWPAPILKPLTIPWLSLGVALLVVPFVAILGAGMLTRSRLPIERRM